MYIIKREDEETCLFYNCFDKQRKGGVQKVDMSFFDCVMINSFNKPRLLFPLRPQIDYS